MPADKDGALCVNILVYTPMGYTQNFRACSMACGKFHNFVLLIRQSISLPDATTDSTSGPLSVCETAVPVSLKHWTSRYCCIFANNSFIWPLLAASSSNLLFNTVKAFSPVLWNCSAESSVHFCSCNVGLWKNAFYTPCCIGEWRWTESNVYIAFEAY